MPVQIEDLEHAFKCASMDGGRTHAAFVDRQTGSIYVKFAPTCDQDHEELAELPHDLDTSARYLRVPDRWQLGLDTPVVMAFAREHLPEDLHAIEEMFTHHDAIDAFKALLVARGLDRAWYAYEAAAENAGLRRWAAENRLDVDD